MEEQKNEGDKWALCNQRQDVPNRGQNDLVLFSQYLNFKGCMDNNDLVMLLNSGGLERGRDFEEPGDINFDKLYVHWILYVHFFLNRCTIFVLLYYVLGEKILIWT